MDQLWTDAVFWWLRLACAGGLLLLAGLAIVSICRQPVRRLRVSSWTLAISLLLLPLTLLPGWLSLPFQIAPKKESALRPSTPVVAGSAAVPSAAPSFAENHYEQPAVYLTMAEPSNDFVATAPVAHRPATVAPPAETRVGAAAPVVASASSEWRWIAWICNALLLVYAGIVLLLLARLGLGQLQLMRLWRSSRPAPERARRILDRLTRQFHCRPALRVSDSAIGPICFGLLRRRILMPSMLAEIADENALRWILAHELSHLERRDPLIGWLIGLAQSLFFFWPWFWKLRREMRLNQEYLADAMAVRMSKRPGLRPPVEDYADFLVRLTSNGAIPVSAAGVKSPSSDLFRRITMLLQKSGNVESTCSRRWSFAAGFGMLTLGLILAGFHLSARAEPAPEKKPEPAKKESVEDIEKEVQRALDALRKGPAAEPKKEEKEPPARNAESNLRKAEEAMRKAQKALADDPRSDENRRAYQAAVQAYQEAFRMQMQQQNGPFRQVIPPIVVGPADPADIKELQRMMEQAQRQLMEQMQQMQQLQQIPGARLPMINGFGRGMGRLSNYIRLGVRLEKPSATLVEQLDLPQNKGMVVLEVVGDSAAAKGGIKANDIILEIGGKAVPSDALELQNVMREFKADQKVEVVVLRKGKKETLKEVTLPESRENPARFPEIRPLQPGNLRRLNPVFPPEAFDGNADGVRQSVQVSNGEFTIKHAQNNVEFTIVGTKDDGRPKVTSIVVQDNGKTIKAESIDKLDAPYRAKVEQLLRQVR